MASSGRRTHRKRISALSSDTTNTLPEYIGWHDLIPPGADADADNDTDDANDDADLKHQQQRRSHRRRVSSPLQQTDVLLDSLLERSVVNCVAPFNGGRRIVYGTDKGVYISDLRDISKDPVKVPALLDVGQVDVLEDYQLLIVLSEHQVLTFPLDALDPMDSNAGLKRA
ncbi:hypothetical protein B0H14DRAFT_3501029 [Mycena olivaceomarginata]|nr:hypothetical protein B0H14DRAFT_3501029 [Mycena olivaceomarginata]